MNKPVEFERRIILGNWAETFVSEVKILGITFKIKLVKEDVIRKTMKEEKRSKNDTSIYFGCVDFGREIIFINKNLSEQRKLRTLWHEINHIIVYDYNAGFEGGTFDEERVVDCFSKGFVQILEDNPRLLDMFRGKEEKDLNGGMLNEEQ